MQDPRGVTPVVVFVTGTGGEITRGPWFLEEEAVTSNFKRALRRYVDLPTNIGPACLEDRNGSGVVSLW